jgi:hypothetical protein
MSDFHSLVRSIHAEVWESGPSDDAALSGLLSDLARTAPPPGVSRLPSAHLAPGPHLGAQEETAAMEDDLRRRREARRADRARSDLAWR